MTVNRKAFLALGVVLVGAAPRPMPSIETIRDAGCTCCEGWVALARAAGYRVSLHDLPRDQRLARFGLTEATAGCHTSAVGGYLIEGHVPLGVVAKLLRERPRVRGIAIPGMPTGIAGMSGRRSGPVDVMTLERRPRVFARIS